MSWSESLMDLGLGLSGSLIFRFFPLLFFTHSVLSSVASVTLVWVLGIVYKISEALTDILWLQKINTFACSRSPEGNYPNPIDDWIHWELRFILFDIYHFLSISSWHSLLKCYLLEVLSESLRCYQSSSSLVDPDSSFCSPSVKAASGSAQSPSLIVPTFKSTNVSKMVKLKVVFISSLSKSLSSSVWCLGSSLNLQIDAFTSNIYPDFLAGRIDLYRFQSQQETSIMLNEISRNLWCGQSVLANLAYNAHIILRINNNSNNWV